MTRHFGNPTSGQGAVPSHPVRSLGVDTLRDAHNNIIRLPSRPFDGKLRPAPTGEPSGSSLSSRPWGVQIAIDVAAVASAVFLIAVTGLSVPIALGLLFFGAF